jgi:hypothetical protein
MTLDVVRDKHIENELVEFLRKHPHDLYNLTKLKEKLGCSRGKVEKAVSVLLGQDSVETVQVGTSWVVRLKHSSGNDGVGQR